MTVVQFVKAIVEESSLKGFDVLWANARERKLECAMWTELSIDEDGDAMKRRL